MLKFNWLFWISSINQCHTKLRPSYEAATRKHLTLPETNVAPENRPSGKGDSYWKPPFSGAMLVSGRVTSLHRSLAKSWNLPGRRKKPPPANASAVGPAEDRNINVLR